MTTPQLNKELVISNSKVSLCQMMRDSCQANGVMKIHRTLMEIKKVLVKHQNKTCNKISKIKINLKVRDIILLEHCIMLRKFRDQEGLC